MHRDCRQISESEVMPVNDSEVIDLIRENNAMLKRIVAYIDKVDGQLYRDNEDAKAFLSNVIADLLVDNNQRQNRLNNPSSFI